jgi:hypothetical protein
MKWGEDHTTEEGFIKVSKRPTLTNQAVHETKLLQTFSKHNGKNTKGKAILQLF